MSEGNEVIGYLPDEKPTPGKLFFYALQQVIVMFPATIAVALITASGIHDDFCQRPGDTLLYHDIRKENTSLLRFIICLSYGDFKYGGFSGDGSTDCSLPVNRHPADAADPVCTVRNYHVRLRFRGSRPFGALQRS